MKQLMTARQTIECYLSPMNNGSQYLNENFPKMYSHIMAKVRDVKEEKALSFTLKFIEADEDDEHALDACGVLRACADEMDEVLINHPTYLHSATGIDGYGRLVMVFRHSVVSRESVNNYMKRMEVE